MVMVKDIRMFREEHVAKYATSTKGLPKNCDLILFEMNGIRMYTTSTEVAELVKFCEEVNFTNYKIYCKINTEFAVNMEEGIPVTFVTYDPGIYTPGIGTCIEISELKDSVNAFKEVLETGEPSLF